jgi:hypothetical protein
MQYKITENRIKCITYNKPRNREPNLFYKIRVRDEAKSAPQGIVDVGPQCLQLCGEPAIDDGASTSPLDQLFQRALRHPHIRSYQVRFQKMWRAEMKLFKKRRREGGGSGGLSEGTGDI